MSAIRLSELGRQILSRYRDARIGTRLYLNARWRWTPYEQIAACVPADGNILDLGAGHGLLSLTMGLSEPRRTIRGIDHEPGRVSLAKHAAIGLTNLEFSSGNLLDVLASQVQRSSLAAIIIMDAIHYLTFDEQERFLNHARQALQPGGVLLMRDVDANAGKSFFINRVYERTMTSIGFTRADRLNFRTRSNWHELLTSAGFDSLSEPCSRFPFADLLFVSKLPSIAAAQAA